MQVYTFSPKRSSELQLLFVRFIQGVTSLGLIAAICLLVIFTKLSVADLFASVLAFIPTGWGILCVSDIFMAIVGLRYVYIYADLIPFELVKQWAVTWKKLVRSLGLWDSVREFARMYDAGMGVLIFTPIAILSWFPFVSTFQSRLLFNQAFSRGLEISLILAGNKANVEV